MFAKRAQSPANAAAALGSGFGRLQGAFAQGGPAVQGLLANPVIGVAGAAGLFLATAIALIAVTGDPRAGAELVDEARDR